MRRITITTGLVAAALATAPAAHGATLGRADAEPVAVRHIQRSAQNKAAYGLYAVTNTSYRCQRIRAGRFACNFALFIRGLIPQATEQVCLSTVTIVRTRGGRIGTQQPADLTCG